MNEWGNRFIVVIQQTFFSLGPSELYVICSMCDISSSAIILSVTSRAAYSDRRGREGEEEERGREEGGRERGRRSCDYHVTTGYLPEIIYTS